MRPDVYSSSYTGFLLAEIALSVASEMTLPVGEEFTETNPKTYLVQESHNQDTEETDGG